MLELGILVVSILGNLVLGGLAYRANPKSKTNQLFLGLVVVTALWLISNYFSFHIKNIDSALFSVRVVIFFAVAQIFSLFLFVYTFPDVKIRLNRIILIFLTFYTVLLMLFTLSPYVFTGLITLDPVPNPVPGPGIPFFGLYAIALLCGIIYLLVRKTNNARGILKQQLAYLSFGIITTFGLVAISDFILVVFFGVTRFLILTPLYTFILVGAISYSIVAHRLFDIRLIIRKTVVYSGLLGFALGIYSLIVLVFSQFFGGQAPEFTIVGVAPSIIAALLIAVGFDPLRKWLTQSTDKFLFKGEYVSADVLRKLAEVLGSVVDLDEALLAMMQIIVREMRLSTAATFILRYAVPENTHSHEEHPKDHRVIELKRIKHIGYSDPAPLQLQPNDPLISLFTNLKHPIVTEEYAKVHMGDPQIEAIVKKLQSFRAAVAMPIFVRSQLIGILIVGEKKSGDAFTDQDLKVLEIAATETAAAIEKARFFEEDQVKSEFVSIASHELLTPTAAIEGYLSMILDENLAQVDTKAREYLTRVYGSAKRLSALVKDLLNVSRIEAGRVVIDRQPMDVTTIIQGVLDDLKFNAQKNKVTLQLLKPNQPIAKAYADEEKTIQIVTNLVGNAIKYNKPNGKAAVSVAADKGFVIVSVADTGLGIPQLEQPHLFEKFYRASNAATSAIQGTGLGLFIVKQIVTMMGGTISFKSQHNVGSTFWFTLPVATGKEKRTVTGDPKLMTPEQQALLRGGEGQSPGAQPAPADAAAQPIAKEVETR